MNPSKRSYLAVIGIVVLGLSYFIGFKSGVKSVPAESLVASVANKDGHVRNLGLRVRFQALCFR
jgi:uncharacterized membrane protein YczE